MSHIVRAAVGDEKAEWFEWVLGVMEVKFLDGHVCILTWSFSFARYENAAIKTSKPHGWPSMGFLFGCGCVFGIEAPYRGAFGSVGENISKTIELVLAIANGLCPCSFRPKAARIFAQALLPEQMRCVFFGDANPMMGAMIAKTREQMEMFCIDGNDQHFDVARNQLFDDRQGDEGPQLSIDPHRLTFHERL